jgi:hypothetical protein
MKYVLLVLLVAGTTALRAQQLAANSMSVKSPLSYYSTRFDDSRKIKQAVPGERMRNAGRMMTIGGVAMFVGGIALASNAESTHYQYNSSNGQTYEEGDPQGALGALMIVGGAGLTIPGIILWTKGAKRYNASKDDNDMASVGVGRNGLAIRYNF